MGRHVLWAVGCDPQLQQQLESQLGKNRLNFSEPAPQDILRQVATCQGIFLGPKVNGGTGSLLLEVNSAVAVRVRNGEVAKGVRFKQVFLFQQSCEGFSRFGYLSLIPISSVDQLMEHLTPVRQHTGTLVH